MEPANAISEFLLLQKQLIDLYHGVIDRAATDCGLSRPEADVLLFLHNNPQYNTARDVAEYRGVSRAYVSRAVELLLGRGLLRVDVHPTDRRYQLLALTGEATAVLDGLLAAQAGFRVRLTAGISPEESAILRRIFTQISKNVAQTP